jgi:hypothetical protein
MGVANEVGPARGTKAFVDRVGTVGETQHFTVIDIICEFLPRRLQSITEWPNLRYEFGMSNVKSSPTSLCLLKVMTK